MSDEAVLDGESAVVAGNDASDTGAGDVRGYRWWITGAALLSVLVRIRFVFTPISSDEGGYLAIARAWRHGADLYGTVWVDRPQGMLLVYRLYDMVDGNEDRLRIIALVFGAVAVVAVAHAVRVLSNERAGVVAGLALAVLSASPAIEGYAANGELLSSTLSAAALAVGCTVLVGRRSGRWMVVAGVLGGIGWSIKQSGVDGPMAIGVWLLVAAVIGWMSWRTALVRLAQLAVGAAAVIALLALHGALTGWADWWYAIIGYRSSQRSALTGARWDRIAKTGWDALRLFAPALIAAAVAALLANTRGARVFRNRQSWIVPIWLLMAVFTFVVGGQFFHHYWVILSFPVAALTGLAIGAVPKGRTVVLLAALATVPAVVGAASVAVLSRHDVPIAISNEPRPLIAEHVGHYIRDHKEPGDSFYALCAAAHSYAHSGIDPEYRFLWIDGVHQGQDAQKDLHELFLGENPPTWVAAFDKPLSCDPSGIVLDVLATAYVKVGMIDQVGIYHLRQ